ncbi:MAG: hypothetical protein U5K31_10410 [Balneolaceae bacterium]|nr:hypothetical protein [Balneolaceae bacterium]
MYSQFFHAAFKTLRTSFIPAVLLGCMLLLAAAPTHTARAQQAETLFDGIESHGGFGELGVDYYAQTGYGGFEMEYYNRSHRLVHVTLSAMIGGGGIGVSRDFEDDEVLGDYQTYFLLEPAANLELNVASFFRIAAGVSYRLTSGIDKAGFDDGHFSGLTGKLTLKFGAFL